MDPSTDKLLGVIFDMDGVLCDSEEYICEAACRMFSERHNTEVHPEDFIPFVGAGENRYLGGVAEKYGVRLDIESDKARTYEIYLEIIKGRLGPLPGAQEFVANCRSHHLKLALATSADRVKLQGTLSEIGIPPETFDVCISGSEVRNKKPHPEIFLLAAERLHLPSVQCLVVEDAPNGVRAGKAAGSPTLALTTSFGESNLRAAGADWIAPDLAHVPSEVLTHF